MSVLKKKILTVVAVILVLLAGAACTAYFAGDYVVNRFMLTTRSDQEYFEWLAKLYTDVIAYGMEHSEGEAASEDDEPLLRDSAVNLGIDLLYGEGSLLAVDTTFDLNEGKWLASIPTYKQGAVSLLTPEDMETVSDTGDGQTETTWLDDIRDLILELPSPAESAELFRSAAYGVIDRIDKVSVDKGYSSYVGEEQIEYNRVTVYFDEGELYYLLGYTLSRLQAEGMFADYVPMEGLKNVSGEVTFFITDRARPVGIEIVTRINSVKLEFEAAGRGTDSGALVQVKLDVNSLRAASSLLEFRLGKGQDEALIDMSTDIELGSILTSLAGLKKNVTLRVSFAIGGAPFVSDEEIVCGFADMMESGYLSIGELLRYLARLRDELDNTYVNEFLDSMIGDLVGIPVKFDMLLMFADMGLFDMPEESEPTPIPTATPTPAPTATPVPEPSQQPMITTAPRPSAVPVPTATPTPVPTATPTPVPTATPTPEPTATPKPVPTATPTPEPTATPTPEPTATPTPEPTATPTPVPTATPTPEPTATPTPVPTATPTPVPTATPTPEPTATPTPVPTATPIPVPTEIPSQPPVPRERLRYDASTLSVEYGDEVYIDITPVLYGMIISSLKYRDAYALIGDNMYGDGLDEQIIGMRIGDKKLITTTIPLELPDGFPSEFLAFAGQRVTVQVQLTDIERYYYADE